MMNGKLVNNRGRGRGGRRGRGRGRIDSLIAVVKGGITNWWKHRDYDQCLTEKETTYLCDFDSKESNLYGLPKVHKSAQIQNTVRDQNNIYVETFRTADLKLRPIIAGPEILTQRLSHFIDLVIKHLCPSIPSYIKDDMEFLNHIPAIVPEETLLTSFDVTSL
ncbi:Hypothetical predicted protein [Mytilus galloprovincialis]|uniref:Uncharacterized protein n=1 Tax=Mytilus galloprovincialis TaxID=29158 RepID=A0A8B6C277_MYTGA|nr:Hypothetical predicted protein [Mytilus galloprovincialis]